MVSDLIKDGRILIHTPCKPPTMHPSVVRLFKSIPKSLTIHSSRSVAYSRLVFPRPVLQSPAPHRAHAVYTAKAQFQQRSYADKSSKTGWNENVRRAAPVAGNVALALAIVAINVKTISDWIANKKEFKRLEEKFNPPEELLAHYDVDASMRRSWNAGTGVSASVFTPTAKVEDKRR